MRYWGRGTEIIMSHPMVYGIYFGSRRKVILLRGNNCASIIKGVYIGQNGRRKIHERRRPLH